MEQYLVRLFQGVLKRDALPHDGQEPLIGHDDHRIDVLAHFRDAHLCLAHALAPFEQEWLGHNSDAERAEIAGDLGNDRRRAGAGAAPHTAGHEHEVRPLQRMQHFVPVFLNGLATDFRPRPRAKAARQLFADLDFDVGLVVEQRLGVGIHGDELDAAHMLVDHAVQGVAAAPTHADDLHPRVLRDGFFEFEDHGSPLGPSWEDQKKS